VQLFNNVQSQPIMLLDVAGIEVRPLTAAKTENAEEPPGGGLLWRQLSRRNARSVGVGTAESNHSGV
jgi:hypothetical protein